MKQVIQMRNEADEKWTFGQALQEVEKNHQTLKDKYHFGRGADTPIKDIFPPEEDGEQ